MKTHEYVCKCPHCGAEHDAATNVNSTERGKVTQGSIIICIDCGKPALVEESGPRPLTDEEWDTMPPIDKQLILKAMRHLRNARTLN